MAGFVAPGQDVLIRYQAFPYQMYGLQRGRIVDISTTPFTTAELPASLAAMVSGSLQQGGGYNGREGLYRVRVQLARQSIAAEGRKRTLLPGMALDADIVQDKRRIWEWIIKPAWAAATGG
jgi:membrane fusion protein